jgi:hypothetical protein
MTVAPGEPLSLADRPGQPPRTPGALKGRIKIHEGFDELPPDIAAAFGIEPGRSGLANPG